VDFKSNQINFRQMSKMKHKEQSEYVDRTQRQYETALTRALKIKTTLQRKFEFGSLSLRVCSRGSASRGSICGSWYSWLTHLDVVRSHPERLQLGVVVRREGVRFQQTIELLEVTAVERDHRPGLQHALCLL